ncbi:indole-3-glycerol-phosphate synthase TrpC [Streptomyces sp. PRKS01-65]|nr:indole-3-glycerol-phosphate synthase TrpC [Streptomyces harenosi]
MTGLLARLVAAAERQTARRRARISPGELDRRVAAAPPPRDLVAALAAPGLSVIAELKPRSPVKGPLTGDYQPVERALAYVRGGAAALSVLTHEEGFGGRVEDLAAVRAHVGVPLVRKDFVVDEFQVREARAAGADAVLLIVAALTPRRLAELTEQVHRLGMTALVEVHDAAEARTALAAGARVIGVNHRDLRDFTLHRDLTARLRPLVGAGRPLVAESGVRGPRDAGRLYGEGADAVLVGETLMRSADPAAAVRALARATALPRTP